MILRIGSLTALLQGYKILLYFTLISLKNRNYTFLDKENHKNLLGFRFSVYLCKENHKNRKRYGTTDCIHTCTNG